tara:strand:+ start:4262 stop:5122 length:861 start_codon:yes stop_codon:yes gene_type:complete
MTTDDLILTGVYLVCSFALFWIGKLVYDLTTPSYSLREQLVEHDNPALAVALVGYYLGLVIAIGGVMSGPSKGLEEDLADIGVYGALAILLLNLARILNDRLVLRKFKVRDELIEDHNVGTGAVVFSAYVATGLIVYGAVSGVAVLDTTGTVLSVVVFWLMGQVALAIAGIVYDTMTAYDVHAEIERDNVAAGIAFGGALVGLGNILRHAAAGDLISWSMTFQEFGFELLVGLILLPIVRTVTDMVLLPGARLHDEIANQEHPNVGAGFIEAFAYVGASFLIVWSL